MKTIEKQRRFEGFLTADEVAEMLHVHRRTVWNWIRQGKLKAAKLGRSWRIREADFEAFVREAFGDDGVDQNGNPEEK